MIKLILSALFSIYSVQWIFLKILKISKIKGLVDNPNVRKLQKNPMPVLGGLAVFFGFLMGLLFFCAVNVGEITVNSPLIIGAGILLFFGAMDDILNLTPKSRILIEIAVMLGLIYGSGLCIDSLYGLWGIQNFSWWIAVPFTVFVGVGIINAYNMVDGVNGLSSGLCIVCGLYYAIIFWHRMEYSDCALAVCFSASMLPFFFHNVFGKKSRMYIGDSGTMVMGIIVTWFSIRILSSTHNPNIEGIGFLLAEHEVGLVAMVLSIASVPVFDTVRVMFMRILAGKSPFVGDKTHLHHIFISVGFSHFFTTIIEILINSFVVLVFLLSYMTGMSVDSQLYMTIAASIIGVWGTYYFMLYHVNRKSRLYSLLKNYSSHTHLGEKKWWLRLQQFLDREAFEDYRLIIVNRYNKPIEELTKIEIYESSIVNYLQGRNQIRLSDLREEGLVADQYFDVVINSLLEKNILECIKRNYEGTIEILRITKGSI